MSFLKLILTRFYLYLFVSNPSHFISFSRQRAPFGEAVFCGGEAEEDGGVDVFVFGKAQLGEEGAEVGMGGEPMGLIDVAAAPVFHIGSNAHVFGHAGAVGHVVAVGFPVGDDDLYRGVVVVHVGTTLGEADGGGVAFVGVRLDFHGGEGFPGSGTEVFQDVRVLHDDDVGELVVAAAGGIAAGFYDVMQDVLVHGAGLEFSGASSGEDPVDGIVHGNHAPFYVGKSMVPVRG